jgi:hypothetical protein
MQTRRDLTNQKFNKLTAIKYVGKDKNEKTLWLFKCECGNEKVIRGTNVTSGTIKSCGVCTKKKCNFKQSQKQKEYTTKLHGDRLRSKTNLYKNNKSGYTGIHKRKNDGRYTCSICINGKKYQTTKSTLEEAINWRNSYARNRV